MYIRARQFKSPLAKVTSVAALVAATCSASFFTQAQESDEAERSQIEVIKGQTDVAVKHPAPSVDVQQKDPQVDVAVGKPEVDINYEDPEVTVQQQKPEVSIVQAEPQVEVNSAKPKVKVNQAEPEITIESSEPEINIVRRDERGEIREDSDKAMVAHMTIDELEDNQVFNGKGEEVAAIEEVVMQTQDNQLFLVVESGGMMGLGEKKNVVPLEAVTLEDGDLLLTSNKDIQQFPEYVESRYSTVTEKQETIETILGSE
jgi:sporulation protein YlmC with PRC-barrel domain